MRKLRHIFRLATIVLSTLILTNCSGSDDEGYEAPPIIEEELPIDFSQVPYDKLSDYGFFTSPINEMKPSTSRVLPYEPSSELFTDYAKKKRFVWMPEGVNAVNFSEDKILNFPIGTILIKNFYYEQVAPTNTQRIIETRLLVKTTEATNEDSGWHTYNYIWNDEQTEAYYDELGNGSLVPITFQHNGVSKSITYTIPATMECKMCHKKISQFGELIQPIGTKLQNLNKTLHYGAQQMNQIQKWIEVGYLAPTISADFASTVDWKDVSQPLDKRAKSYLDMNCAHCHSDGGHCDYTTIRLNYSNLNEELWGVCSTVHFWDVDASKIIHPGDSDQSSIVLRMESTQVGPMMPMLGRSIVHEEGVALIREWIDQMTTTCE